MLSCYYFSGGSRQCIELVEGFPLARCINILWLSLSRAFAIVLKMAPVWHWFVSGTRSLACSHTQLLSLYPSASAHDWT